MKSAASGGAREVLAGSPQPAAWSESFQDLGSWCLPHRDELNTPVINNQNEFSFSFDDQSDQSKYGKWDESPPPLEFQSMWGDSGNMMSPLLGDEDNGEFAMHKMEPVESSSMDTSDRFSFGVDIKDEVRYKGNLVLTQCTVEDQQFKEEKWSDQLCEIKQEEGFDNMFKPPVEKSADKRERPNLKVNIAKANQPSPMIASDINPLSTPDVIKSLTNAKDFNILNYFEGLEDCSALGSEEQYEPMVTSQQADPEDIKSDHDYTSPETSRIKEEPPASPIVPAKRSRRPPTSTDFHLDAEDDSSDWSPSEERRRRKSRSTKRSRKSSESDAASIASSGDRYRELRNRNNEASRRSRINRKRKEAEMMELSFSLEKNNALLKIKAVNLEKRVKTLRKVLMKVVMDKNSKI